MNKILIIIFSLIISINCLEADILKEKYDPKKLEIDRVWFKKLLNGGFILHFRHAERDKWIDVEIYDALETHEYENGVNIKPNTKKLYFANAVCLNDRGKVQARAMGEYLNKIKLPISYVVSSPSCRARQTSELAFNGYDDLNVLLVHRGPYDESGKDHIDKLRNFYKTLPITKGFNVVISGHNSTLHMDMFDNKDEIKAKKFKGGFERLTLEEGGFFVISKSTNINGEIILNLEHQFHNFLLFSRFLNNR